MNAYFFNTSPEERNNILDQHKKVYDGFVTTYGQQINQQPLYVQDYANDKEGLTVNNKGVVKTYTNMNINEANAMTGSKYVPDVSFDFGGPDDEFEKEYDGFDGKDKIGDSKTDLEHGTFGEEEPEFDEVNLFDLEDGLDEDDIVLVQEQVNKTLDMFKRFKKY
jgi:hypothetical protein